jgi:bacterioferritin (cytochrome b1)
MATMVGLRGDVAAVLHQLIELDYDAVEAYRAAIDRLHDTDAKNALTEFMHDHERHVADLGAELRGLGREPPRGPDLKRVLTEGKVVVAGLLGDRAVLMAMKTNEDDTNVAYERVAARSDLTAEQLLLVRRNLTDEKRHRTWIEQRLSSMRAEAHP